MQKAGVGGGEGGAWAACRLGRRRAENEVAARSGLLMDSSGTSSSDTSSDDGDELVDRMNEIRRSYRVFCMQLVQANDIQAAKRMMEVWDEVFTDVSFLDEVQAEFDRKEAEEQLEFFDYS